MNLKNNLFIFIFLTFLASSSFAFSWNDLWFTPDQQAQRQLKKGNTKKAAEKFETPAWRGVANYRSEQYEQALKDFSQGNTIIDIYNRGNALAHLGQYEEAIAAYERVLQKNPNDADAKYNIELLKKLLQQQKNSPDQKQQPPKNDSQKNDKNQNQKDENKPNDQSNEQNQPDTQKDQKNSSDENQSQDQKPNQPNNQDPKKDPQNQPQQPSNEKENPKQSNQEAAQQNPEEKRSQEQWLHRVPDDPGGLLRRKFMRDHLQNLQN